MASGLFQLERNSNVRPRVGHGYKRLGGVASGNGEKIVLVMAPGGEETAGVATAARSRKI